MTHPQPSFLTHAAARRSLSPRAIWLGTGAALIGAAAIAATIVSSPSAPAPTPVAAAIAPPATTKSSGKVANPAPAPVRAVAAVCTTCGVVESVATMKVKGEGTGLGAVGGAVLGGVIGHQMGGGTGRDAMTAVGVVGGGIAGHEVEKRARATTQYQVKVRMQDGTLRTVTQSTAPTVGQKVTLNAGKLVARA